MTVSFSISPLGDSLGSFLSLLNRPSSLPTGAVSQRGDGHLEPLRVADLVGLHAPRGAPPPPQVALRHRQRQRRHHSPQLPGMSVPLNVKLLECLSDNMTLDRMTVSNYDSFWNHEMDLHKLRENQNRVSLKLKFLD